jgi:hypothetical protein
MFLEEAKVDSTRCSTWMRRASLATAEAVVQVPLEHVTMMRLQMVSKTQDEAATWHLEIGCIDEYICVERGIVDYRTRPNAQEN